MKKLLLYIYFIFNICLSSFAQEEYKSDSLYLNVRAFYQQMDKTGRQHDLLFNYGFIYSDLLEVWHNGYPVITKSQMWKLLYHSCIESDLTHQLVSENIDSLVDYNRNNEETNISELAILSYKGDYLTVNSLEQIIVDNSPPEFESMHIFSGVALKYYLYDDEILFRFKPQNFYSNFSDSFAIAIDFDDELGFRTLDVETEQIYNVIYDCVGEKGIIFRRISGNDTIYSYSSINIVTLEKMIPTSFGEISVLDSTYDAAMLRSSDPNINLAYANYKYFEGCDNKLDRPVIIAEGFDILGNQSASNLAYYWRQTIERLQLRGYDVFVLNFRAPGRSLITNANIIMKLIKEINENKVGNHEGVFVG